MSQEPDSGQVRLLGGQRQETKWRSGTTRQMPRVKLGQDARKANSRKHTVQSMGEPNCLGQLLVAATGLSRAIGPIRLQGQSLTLGLDFMGPR